MRYVAAISLFVGACSLALASDRPVTVVLEFESAHSIPVVRTMEQEAARLLADLDYQAEWRDRSSLSSSDSFERVVMIRFHGACDVSEPRAARVRTKQRLGYAHVQDGAVLPFADVDCALVRDYIGDSTRRGYAAAEQAYGLALGRVIAHELDHILSQSKRHESAGLMQESVSSSDLARVGGFESAR